MPCDLDCVASLVEALDSDLQVRDHRKSSSSTTVSLASFLELVLGLGEAVVDACQYQCNAITAASVNSHDR